MFNNEKIKRVVGLQYKPGEGLPKVILKGSGQVAEEILKKRNLETGPRVVKDEKLAKQLYRLPIDADISKDLFDLVAMLLAHIFSVDEKIRGERDG